jgi:Domain of Unknown Function (DUF748)
MPRPARRHRVRRAAAIGVGVLLVLIVAVRLALTPFLEWRLRRSFEHMHDLRGTFSRLEISVLQLSATVYDLRIEKLSREGRRTPYLQLARWEFGLYGTELLHGHLVCASKAEHPKVSLVSSPRPRQQQLGEAPEIGKKLQSIMPFRLDRLEVRDGEVLWIDAAVPERPRLWLHAVEATVENLASRAALAKGEPSVLAASGTLQKTGKVSLFASADPLAKGLTFAGQARLVGLQLPELGELLAATTELTPSHGTLDLSLRFKSVDGHVTGGIRPVLKNPGLQQAKPGLGAKLKEILADIGIELFSDRVPGRNAVATTIPIEGDVRRPDAQVWPTVLGIVRNAFVEGLTNSLAHLPPSGGGEEQQPETKARRARAQASHRRGAEARR